MEQEEYYNIRIRQTELAYDTANREGRFPEAEHYQRELNELRNQRIGAINMMINPMLNWYDEKVLANLTPKPGQVVWTDTTAGSNVVFQKYTSGIDISDETYKKAKELDVRRNIKIFAHFANLFCERYPNWELQPDATDPFHKVNILHKNGKYKIVNQYPMNELALHGAPSNAQDTTDKFSKRHGIPPSIFNITPPTVPTQYFYGWALGLEDVPDFVRE